MLTCFLLPQQGLGSLGECRPNVLFNLKILEGWHASCKETQIGLNCVGVCERWRREDLAEEEQSEEGRTEEERNLHAPKRKLHIQYGGQNEPRAFYIEFLTQDT